MPKYVIELTDEQDAKVKSEFGSVESVFKKVVADACQAADTKVAEAAKPVVVREDEESIVVSKEAVEVIK
jgi:hypothetical protein